MLVHFILLLTFNWSAFGQHNVTIDDSDSSIFYQPADRWSTTLPSQLDVGGTHHLTSFPGATATFVFTGIAVYFLSPLWPYHVTTQVQLDSQAPVLLNLVDTSLPDQGGGAETVQSGVVWSATGLNNSIHQLVVSIGNGEPFAIVDGFIFTTFTESAGTITFTSTSTQIITASDPGPTQSGVGSSPSDDSFSSNGSSPSGSSSPSTGSSSASKGGATGTSHNTVAIVLGAIFGTLGLIIIAGILWLCCKRRKDDHSERVEWPPHTGAYTPAQMVSPPPQSHAAPPANSAFGSRDSWVSHQTSSGSMGNGGHMTGVGSGALATGAGGGYMMGPGGQPYQHGQWPGSAPAGAALLDRNSNRYHSGTLSTITETSAPSGGLSRRGMGTTNSPGSYHTELEYRSTHLADGSERLSFGSGGRPDSSFQAHQSVQGGAGTISNTSRGEHGHMPAVPVPNPPRYNN